jgi:hypothetical protein
MIQPEVRSKTTIGTVTATARVVVETPLLDLLASALDETLEEALVEDEASVEVLEAGSLLSLFEACPSEVLVSATCQYIHIRIDTVGSRTSPAFRTASSIARRTLRRGGQSSIVWVNDGEVVRVHGICPDLQLDGEITPRRRAVRVAEDERAVEAVAAPGV